MDERQDLGMIEGRRRVAEELLASTTFKDGLRLFLKNMDPDDGPAMVRTLMGRDVEVPLAVTSSLPVVANCLIRSAMELVRLVRSQYPAPLLAGMAEALLKDIDRETLARLIREAGELGRDLAPAFSAFADALREQPQDGKEPA